MMSLGQVAEATNVHLDTKAAPHRIHLELMLKLPLMRNFTMVFELSKYVREGVSWLRLARTHSSSST